MAINLSLIEKIIGYEFSNKMLLETAFTHSSYANDNHVDSYERLEFLGDSLLNYITTEFLYMNYDSQEGDLSKMRAKLVSGENICDFMNESTLKSFILLGKSVKVPTQSVVGDVFESLLGAIYLDGGINRVKTFVLDHFIIDKQNVDRTITLHSDYKTMLQEKMQAKNKKCVYTLVNQTGMLHELQFTVELKIGDLCYSACASSLRNAEQLCAKQALDDIK